MSVIKYQLREVLASLASAANGIKDREIKRRFYLLKAVCESKKDIKKTCEGRGVSTDYFYKWARRLLEQRTLLALLPQSRSPKSFWNKTSKSIERRVVRLRKQQPFKGPERISFDLKKKFKIDCPASTVAAILKRYGLVTKAYKERLTKKHLKRYRQSFPGYLQMDFKYTPFLVEGRQSYQLSVVDHHSSWRLIRQYQNRKIETVIDFLNEVAAEAPFDILQIQTDNALEFTDKYGTHNQTLKPTEAHAVDEWCAAWGIDHKLIPIGEKELNGKVENTHRFDDREFFSQNLGVQSFAALEAKTRHYNAYWNQERPTKSLGWQTPNEVIIAAYVRAIAYLKHLMPAKTWESVKPEKQYTLQITSSSIILASKEEINCIRNKQKQNQTKKLTSVDRYLQYLEWEEKQKLKAYLPVPLILQDFSAQMKRQTIG